MTPRVLIVAGSDSGGGAGIQADIKTVTMLGGHAMTAVTAITAQNTLGVRGVMLVDAEFVAEQIAAVVEDIGVDAVKVGMLGSEEIVRMVAGVLVAAPEIGARSAIGWARKELPPSVRRIPIVLDPVMFAKGGARLAQQGAIDAIVNRLLPIATLVTPNTAELEILTDTVIASVEQAEHAALSLARRTGVAVLAKGGHLPGPQLTDVLVAPDGETARWTADRIDTPHTHGTGCTLASAIATGLGAGLGPRDAIERARAYVLAAIGAAPRFGLGHGPMGHGLGVAPYDELR